jgi:GNAT superfamily N-acetyltransferase
MEMEEDNHGYHFGAFADNKLVAVVSLFAKGDDFQFRKFAVIPEWQGQGIGKALINYIADFAINEGAIRLWCNARLSAIGFYAKYGFMQTGETLIAMVLITRLWKSVLKIKNILCLALLYLLSAFKKRSKSRIRYV